MGRWAAALPHCCAMWAYILRRILATIPVLVIVSLVVFSMLHVAPGDPAALIAGDQASPEQIAAIRAKLRLDLPLHEQFTRWAGDVLQGDLGTSIFSNRSVSALFLQRLEPTIALAVLAMLVAVIIAVPIGVLAAWKAGSVFDRGVMSVAVLGFAFPVFVIGYILIYVFAMKLRILPVQGYRPLADGLLPFLRYLILPSFALGLGFLALIARVTRASVLEVLSEDHIRTARAKGLPARRLLFDHALPNAAVPIVTIIGLGVAQLLGGVVVTESVFAIPGLGRLVVDAILARDYPIIQGALLIFSFTYVIVNLAVDLVYVLLDPRIRY
jgi:peptide/nickel transport system permease protein